MTDPNLPSGSDRIFEALMNVDSAAQYDTIINLQGDLPTIDPAAIKACLTAMDDGADIGTIAARISDDAERGDPNVVKVVAALSENQPIARALYFSRATVPYGDGDHFHHIGLYAYRRWALEAFVTLPPSPLEQREKLEQLRALEAGMRIDVSLVDTVPLGVDTPADLDVAQTLLAT
jgi:3-deoxy-manno-octulosonate cytidylyltransferase (CMP-KDO synthetase)